MILPFLVFIALAIPVSMARRGGLGVLGQKIRDSDALALEDAIEEKRWELNELIKLRK